MKISSILLTLYISFVAAQTVTSTSTTNALQSTSASTTPASATSPFTTSTVSIWLNTTSGGATYSVTANGVYCGTTGLALESTYTDSAGYRNAESLIFYHFGSDYFISEYGRNGDQTRGPYQTSQSCTLVGPSSASYFSCLGAHTTSTYLNASFVETSATTTTFTWPTTKMVSTGVPLTTSLTTASCRSAALPAVDAKRAFALAALFCAVLLGVLS